MTRTAGNILATTAIATPFSITPDGWKEEAALNTARQIKEYWANLGAPWVRASVVKVAENTYVVRSNLANGKPLARPSGQVN